MRKVDFSRRGLTAYLNSEPPVGEEIQSSDDRRLRGWNRKRGLALGYELHSQGRVHRRVIGYYRDLPLTKIKEVFAREVSKAQLMGFEIDAPTITEYFNNVFLIFSQRNHKNQKGVISNWRRLSKEFKSLSLNKIKRSDIERELDVLEKRGLSAASQNRVRSLLSRLFRLAEADELITRNPVKHIPPLREPTPSPVQLSEAVLKRYVELAFDATNQQQGLALVLAAVSGARISEVQSIRLSDISHDRRKWLARDTKNGSDRNVFVGSVGAKAIKLAEQFSINAFLFSSSSSITGYITYPTSTHAEIINILQKEGLITKKFKVKDLRSNCASKVYQATKDPLAAKSQLGHKTLNVTLKHYIDSDEEHYSKVAETMDEFLM